MPAVRGSSVIDATKTAKHDPVRTADFPVNELVIALLECGSAPQAD
jgi:hypothetical protein